jgi:hypothetical protein
LPVARTWHAHTSPNPPFPKTLYIRKVFLVTGSLLKKAIFILKDKKKQKTKTKTKNHFVPHSVVLVLSLGYTYVHDLFRHN